MLRMILPLAGNVIVAIVGLDLEVIDGALLIEIAKYECGLEAIAFAHQIAARLIKRLQALLRLKAVDFTV